MNDFSFLSLAKKAASEKTPLSHCRKNITGSAGGYDLRLRYPAGRAEESLAFQGRNSICQNFSTFFKISLDKFKSCDIIIPVRVTRMKTKLKNSGIV